MIFPLKIPCEIFGFFLSCYPYPLNTGFESIENIFFYIYNTFDREQFDIIVIGEYCNPKPKVKQFF